MDQKERVALIRAGNELFNKGEIVKAIDVFEKTNYKDGLARVGDYFFYDKRMPLVALKYYRLANREVKVKEIFERMMYALGKFIREDKEGKEAKKAPEPKEIKVKVSPKLKILAEEILRDAQAKDK